MVDIKSPVKGPKGFSGLMDLAVAYQKSTVLLAATKLGVFAALAHGPLTAREVAEKCATHPRSTVILLNACAALGLLVVQNSSYANTTVTERFLTPGKAAYLGYYLALMEDGYRNWGLLTDAVRENRPVRPRERDSGRDPDWNRRFTLAMHQGARVTAKKVARLLDLNGRRRLIDVGGGSGAFAMELLRNNPALEATIFDLAGVLEITKEVVAKSGLEDRIRLQPGDYHADAFGECQDVVLLFGILHSESLESRRSLLKKAWKALNPGGLVITRQFLLNEDKTGPLEAALFSLQMLLYTEHGEAYSWEEISSLLLETGFVDPSRKPVSARRPYWLVTAHKPVE